MRTKQEFEEMQKIYQSKIADLEAKLAQAKMNESFEKEKKDNAFKFIEELKQQLAEKETRIAELEDKDWYEATIKQLEEANGRLIKQRDDAKLQLAEKAFEVEEYSKFLTCLYNHFEVSTLSELKNEISELVENGNNLHSIVKHLETTQNQKAIAELYKVENELIEFVKRFNGIIYGMMPEQVVAEQIEKCISEKIKMLGENK